MGPKPGPRVVSGFRDWSWSLVKVGDFSTLQFAPSSCFPSQASEHPCEHPCERACEHPCQKRAARGARVATKAPFLFTKP